jgi:homospermidine synthase
VPAAHGRASGLAGAVETYQYQLPLDLQVRDHPGESMPIGDYFTMTSDSGEISYRPTCHYAYYPADDAMLSWHELLGNPAQPQRTHENAAGLQVTSAVLAGSSEMSSSSSRAGRR